MSLLDATPVSSNNPKQPATVSIIHAPHKASEKASGEPLTKEVFNEVHIIPTVPLYPPEGGLRAWLAIAGASFVMFLTFGMIFSFGVFQDYCTRVILSDFTPSDVSWIGSVQTFLLYAMGLYTGKWFDSGHFHTLIIPGSILYVVSFFMLSLCKPQQYYQFFLSQGIGMGLGMGLLTVPSLSIYSHYFQKKRGLANGILTAGSCLGGVLWPIMLNKLIESKVGFPWAIRVGAFLSLGLLTAANFLMRKHPLAKPRPKMSMLGGIKIVFKDAAFIFSLIAVFISGLGLFFPYTYLQLFASLHDLPGNLAQYTTSLFFASATFLGRILPGILGDKYGIINVMLVYTIIGGGLIFLMTSASSITVFIIFTLLYGPCGSVLPSLYTASIACYTNNRTEFGLRLGLGCILYGIGALIGPPINGALLRPPQYRWESAVIFSSVTVLAGCVALLVSRQLLVARKGSQII